MVPLELDLKLRHEFVLKALEPRANISELAREHGISRKTAYKWLERFRERGVMGLEDLSRRPHSSPLRASASASAPRRTRPSCARSPRRPAGPTRTRPLGRLRPYVDPPSRVALVIYGTPGAPADDPKEGRSPRSARRCCRTGIKAADGWYHIHPDGRELAPARHDWCGNFRAAAALFVIPPAAITTSIPPAAPSTPTAGATPATSATASRLSSATTASRPYRRGRPPDGGAAGRGAHRAEEGGAARARRRVARVRRGEVVHRGAPQAEDARRPRHREPLGAPTSAVEGRSFLRQRSWCRGRV